MLSEAPPIEFLGVCLLHVDSEGSREEFGVVLVQICPVECVAITNLHPDSLVDAIDDLFVDIHEFDHGKHFGIQTLLFEHADVKKVVFETAVKQ